VLLCRSCHYVWPLRDEQQRMRHQVWARRRWTCAHYVRDRFSDTCRRNCMEVPCYGPCGPCGTWVYGLEVLSEGPSE